MRRPTCLRPHLTEVRSIATSVPKGLGAGRWWWKRYSKKPSGTRSHVSACSRVHRASSNVLGSKSPSASNCGQDIQRRCGLSVPEHCDEVAMYTARYPRPRLYRPRHTHPVGADREKRVSCYFARINTSSARHEQRFPINSTCKRISVLRTRCRHQANGKPTSLSFAPVVRQPLRCSQKTA